MVKKLVLALALLLAAPAWAAVETTTVNGSMVLSGGATCTTGRITASLSRSGVAYDGPTKVSVGGTTTAIITASVFSLVLVPNDVVIPEGTYYRATLTCTAPTPTSWVENWYVETSPDPIAIGDITRLSVVTGAIIWSNTVLYVSEDPTGACTGNETPRYVTTTESHCQCVNGTWSCAAPGSPGADSIGTAEMKDDLDTPLTGECLVVATDTAEIEYITCPGGTDDQTAVEVPYTPTTAADWFVPPSEALAGLDELASRAADEIDVRLHGATTGDADAGPEIQAAIDAAEAAGRGWVTFHEFYTITTPLVIDGAATGLRGDCNEGVTCGFQLNAAGTALNVGASDVELRNITISGNAVATTGVLVSNGRRLVIANSSVQSFTGSGILIDPDQGPGGVGNTNYVVIRDSNLISNLGYGIEVADATTQNYNGLQLINVRATSNQLGGAMLRGSAGHIFSGYYSDNGNNAACSLDDVPWPCCSGFEAGACDGRGIVFGDETDTYPTHDWLIDNPWAQTNGTAPIDFSVLSRSHVRLGRAFSTAYAIGDSNAQCAGLGDPVSCCTGVGAGLCQNSLKISLLNGEDGFWNDGTLAADNEDGTATFRLRNFEGGGDTDGGGPEDGTEESVRLNLVPSRSRNGAGFRVDREGTYGGEGSATSTMCFETSSGDILSDHMCIDSAGVVTLPSLAEADTRCMQVTNAGVVEVATAACGTGAEVNDLVTDGAAGIAADQIPMGVGTDTVAYKAMASGGTNGCAGAGQALQYNTTTDTWGCLTGLGAGGTVDSIQGDDDVATAGAVLSIDGGTAIGTDVVGDILTIDVTTDFEEEAQIGTTDVTGNAGAVDQMIVGTTTNTAVWANLPSGGTDGCSAAGDKPIYTASTNSWSCGSDGGGAETNTLTTMGSVADFQLPIGASVGVGAYISLAECNADQMTKFTDGAPNTVTCVDISGLTDADIGNISNLATGAVDASGEIAVNVVDGTHIALGSDAQGDVMYYNGTDWVRLGFGTSGHFLQTQGTGANPQWASASGSGDVLGPITSADNTVARFNGTDNKTIQSSAVTIGDEGATTAVTVAVTGTDPVLTAGDGTFDLSTPVTATSFTADQHATEGGEMVLTEGVDDGSNTFSIKVPDAGLTATLQCIVDGTSGRIPDSCVGDGTDDGGAETNTLTTMGGVADFQLPIGASAGVGAYAALAECNADQMTKFTDGAPNTVTCVDISGLTDADIGDISGLAADALNDIGEVAAGLKRGPDATDTHILTTDVSAPGTATCLEMDTDGSVVLAGGACGVAGGEANTLASPDVGSEVDLINSVPKTGTALNLTSLEADHFSVAANIVTIDDDGHAHTTTSISGLVDADIGDISNLAAGAVDSLGELGDICAGTQVLQRNSGDTAWECIATPGAGGDSYGTITDGTTPATADSADDTITLTDTATIDFTTTNDPEDVTADVVPNSIDVAQLATDLAFIDGDSLDLTGITLSASGEGLILPRPADCDAITGLSEGTVCYDTTDDAICVFNGANSMDCQVLGAGGFSDFDVQGDDGAPNVTITSGNTLIVSGGNAITTEDGDAGADTLSVAVTADSINQDELAATVALTAGDSFSLTGTASLEATNTTVAATVVSGTISGGNLVYVTQWAVAEGCIEVALADSDAAGTMPAIGVVTATLTNGDCNGEVTLTGTATVDTGLTVSEGDGLYVSGTAGAFTATKPTGTALVQKVAVGVRENGGSDIIQMVGAGRSNDVPNIASANFWLGNGSGVPAAVTMSGDAQMDNAGALTIQPAAVEESMLEADLAFDDGDSINLTGMTLSSTGEGLILDPTADCDTLDLSPGTVCYDDTDDKLCVDDSEGNMDCISLPGGGGGDNVEIDGVAAENPDFTGDGDVTPIRCTGAGAPDDDCVALEDVIYRNSVTPTTAEAATYYCGRDWDGDGTFPELDDVADCITQALTDNTTVEDGTDAGVVVVIPEGTWALDSDAGFNCLDASGGCIALEGGMTFVGEVPPRLKYISGQAPDLVMQINGGSWLDCGGAGTTCFTGTNVRSAHVKDLGLTNVDKGFTFGGDGVEGWSMGSIVNIIGLGYENTGLADWMFELTNIQHLKIDYVKGYRFAEGMTLRCQLDQWEGINSVITEPYFYMSPGHNAGIEIHSLDPTVGGTEQLGCNYVTIIRPQVNSFQATGAGPGIWFHGTEAAANITSAHVIAADIEGGGITNALEIDFTYNSSIELAGSSNSITGNEFDLDSNSAQNVLYSHYDQATINAANRNNTFFGVFAGPDTSDVTQSKGMFFAPHGSGTTGVNNDTQFWTVTDYIDGRPTVSVDTTGDTEIIAGWNNQGFYTSTDADGDGTRPTFYGMRLADAHNLSTADADRNYSAFYINPNTSGSAINNLFGSYNGVLTVMQHGSSGTGQVFEDTNAFEARHYTGLGSNYSVTNLAFFRVDNTLFDAPTGGSITSAAGVWVENLGGKATNTDAIRIDAQTGGASSAQNNLRFVDGDFDGGHVQLGSAHVWSNGVTLYGNQGAPTTATDGTDLLTHTADQVVTLVANQFCQATDTSTLNCDVAELADANVSNTLTSSLFVGSGSTTNAIDLATAEAAGTLTVAKGGTGRTTERTEVECFTMYDVDSLSGITATTIASVWRAPAAVTVTEIYCEVDDATGTPAIQFHKDDGTPTPDMMTTDLNCTVAGATGSTFTSTEDAVADGNRLDLEIVTATANQDRMSVCVEYTYD